VNRSRVALGRRGEALATDELARHGWAIVARNWRCAEGEVDIVARRGEAWRFVEVRTRRGSDLGTPEDSLTPAKQTRMAAVAEAYLTEHGLERVDWQLMLAAVEMDHGGRLVRLELVELE